MSFGLSQVYDGFMSHVAFVSSFITNNLLAILLFVLAEEPKLKHMNLDLKEVLRLRGWIILAENDEPLTYVVCKYSAQRKGRHRS